ncbi:MAG: Rrf2 family transcriptional regulator [bacterium]
MDRILFSNAFSLALHSLVMLAESSGKTSSTAEIAAEIGVSSHHLSKVHTRLVRHGLLRSIRGPGGGLQLSLSPHEITLMDIYSVIEGPFPLKTCMLGKRVCERISCIFGDFFRDYNDRLRNYFEQTYLSDLIEKGVSD